ncbi:MAG TPA: LPXTG cell wall anchor domain-containing protein [Pilimelia sp.]|nr:LPXTG cell wall anchor domain-containing protein [Pilimelia sp.]
MLTTGAVAAAPTVAHADHPDAPDLTVTSPQARHGVTVHQSGAAVTFVVHNEGKVDAEKVTLTVTPHVDTARVTTSLNPAAGNCALAGQAITCRWDRVRGGQRIELSPLRLALVPGARPGTAGWVDGRAFGEDAEADPHEHTNYTEVEVIAGGPGPDLVALAEDANDPQRRVGPGDRAPVVGEVRNAGDRPAAGFRLSLSMGPGVGFAERHAECTYSTPRRAQEGSLYDAGGVDCVLPLRLEPGEGVRLHDEQPRESLFNLIFGENLMGPAALRGSLSVLPLTEAEAAAATPGALTRALAARRTARAGAAPARAATGYDRDKSNNTAHFRVFTRPNATDVSITAEPATRVAQGLHVGMVLRNHGPADTRSPIVEVTAPSGTLVVPTAHCRAPGAPADSRAPARVVRCTNLDDEFLTAHSIFGLITAGVTLKVVGVPGDDGTVRVVGVDPGDELNPANNVARIVVAASAPAGELPVTGAPTAWLGPAGAAALALGAALFVLARRRTVRVGLPE